MLLTAILVYLAALGAISLYHARRAKTGDDFMVAGRNLPARVLVLTLLSTWIGSGSLFGGAGLGYRAGFAALWQPAGAWAGILLVYFLAPRVRRIAKYTLPDILHLRYGGTARVLGTMTIAIAYLTIAAYQFRGGGRLLNLAAGVDPGDGALLTMIVCVIFTATAGMISVARLDVFNGSMMVGGATFALLYLVSDIGGPGAAFAALRPDQKQIFGTLDPWQDAIAIFLPTMLLLMGEANMYQKFFSAKDAATAKRAVAGWIIATVFVETVIVALGVFGSVKFPGLDTTASEGIVPQIAAQALPLALGMALCCGAAAIIVSTANSMLLAPASALARDIYLPYVNPSASDKQVLIVTRLLVVAIGAIGFVALRFFTTILAMALWAYTMIGAGITPALIAAFVWPRVTRAGGVASIVAGMATTLAWEMAARAAGGAYPLGLPTIYPAVTLAVVALVGVSLSTPPPAEEDVRALA
jgi:SSS family solute:Na+ symporter/sodium/proline symporter